MSCQSILQSTDFGYIYVSINNVTNGYYVGKSSGPFDQKYLGSGTVLAKAIKKYGRENFSVFLIESSDSKKSLDQAEKDYIAILRSYGVRLYNILPGGQGVGSGSDNHNFGKPLSSECKKKMSLVRKGRAPTELHRRNLALSQTGSKNHRWGKVPSLEHRKKISDAWKLVMKKRFDACVTMAKHLTFDQINLCATAT